MDYKTKPTSRKDLRRYAKFVRRLFDVPETGPFPVLQVLDRISDIFKDCSYAVVEDHSLPPQTMCRCVPNNTGGFIIEIKQSVYDGAYEKDIGAFLGFICHEICHIFLFKIGFVPLYERSFEDNTIPAYCSVEWQAKALCAEVMIPFYESHNMSVHEICNTYHCSKAFAEARRKLERRR